MLIDKPKIEKLLVVIGDAELDQHEGHKSTALLRGLAIAGATGAEIELFHVCHEPTFSQKIFSGDSELAEEKERIAAQRASRLAEMTLGVDTNRIPIHREVRWDHPLSDAILRKIEDCEPDLVLIQAQDHDYLLGLMTNVDWELVRRSSAPVWFARDEITQIRNILTAIGTQSNDEDIISAADYDVFRLASAIADAFDAHKHSVHTYQVPAGLPGFSMYGPAIGGATAFPQNPDTLEAAHQAVARKHGDLIRAFAKYFRMDPESIRIEKGDPSEVLPSAADSVHADVIVMGARNLDRWHRILGRVTAEPVLARANCDVLFVKEAAESTVRPPDEQPIAAEPTLDVEAAITQPERVFDSPAEVANSRELSPRLRERILLAWDQDIRAQIREEEEGGKTKAIDFDLLGQIRSAMEDIRTETPVTH